MPQTRLKPIGARLVIEREPLPSQTASGLWLLGREWPAIGTVLAIGNRKGFAAYDPDDVQIGDRVYFDRFAHELRAIPGEPDHFVIDADQCFVRIRKVPD